MEGRELIGCVSYADSIAGVHKSGGATNGDVKLEAVEEVERPRLSNPEDDIFGGVGSDYAPVLPKREQKEAEEEGGGGKGEKEGKEEKKRQRKERGGHKGKYFEQPSELGDALPPPPPSAPPGPQLPEQWQVLVPPPSPPLPFSMIPPCPLPSFESDFGFRAGTLRLPLWWDPLFLQRATPRPPPRCVMQSGLRGLRKTYHTQSGGIPV